jgi:hypothetical protein
MPAIHTGSGGLILLRGARITRATRNTIAGERLRPPWRWLPSASNQCPETRARSMMASSSSPDTFAVEKWKEARRWSPVCQVEVSALSTVRKGRKMWWRTASLCFSRTMISRYIEETSSAFPREEGVVRIGRLKEAIPRRRKVSAALPAWSPCASRVAGVSSWKMPLKDRNERSSERFGLTLEFLLVPVQQTRRSPRVAG